VLAQAAALILFLCRVALLGRPERRVWPPIPLIGLILAATYYIEREARNRSLLFIGDCHFETYFACLPLDDVAIADGAPQSRGAGSLRIFLLSGLHGLDRPLWLDSRSSFAGGVRTFSGSGRWNRHWSWSSWKVHAVEAKN